MVGEDGTGLSSDPGKALSLRAGSQSQLFNGRPMTADEIRTKIGGYVDYTPDNITARFDNFYTGEVGNGDETTCNALFMKDIPANQFLNWRIWDVTDDDKTLLLISDIATSSTPGFSKNIMEFYGANGYNNAVKLLNDVCNTSYGSESRYGIRINARNINVEDIDRVTAYDNAQYIPPFNTSTVENNYTSSNNYKQPSLYLNEIRKSWYNDNAPAKTIGRSESATASTGNYGYGLNAANGGENYVTGCVSGTFRATRTSYLYNTIENMSGMNMLHAGLLTEVRGIGAYNDTTPVTNHTQYWLSSRCVWAGGNPAQFQLFLFSGRQCLQFSTIYVRWYSK